MKFQIKCSTYYAISDTVQDFRKKKCQYEKPNLNN